jgi:integrase
MSKITKPTVKVVLKISKVLANGHSPIMLRVTHQRMQKFFSLKCDSTVRGWNAEAGRYKKNTESNIILSTYETKAQNIILDFEREGAVFTFDLFKKRFFNHNKLQSVFKYFETVINEIYQQGRIGTGDSYTDTLNRLKDFRKDQDCTFHDIDFNFLIKFQKHLAVTNSVNSIGVYMRTLKAIYNRIIKEKLIRAELYPFSDFQIKVEPTAKRALTKAQMLSFINYEAEPGSRKWHSLNYFKFSYLCRGMNFMDMAKLKPQDINNGRLAYKRSKTNDLINVEIRTEIATILSEYPTNGAYIFPILEPGLSLKTEKSRVKGNLKKINKDLQDIGGDLKIPYADDITFYWARHTYATTLKRAGVSTSIISETLGHSSEKVTQTYLDSFENTQLDETYKHLV